MLMGSWQRWFRQRLRTFPKKESGAYWRWWGWLVVFICECWLCHQLLLGIPSILDVGRGLSFFFPIWFAIDCTTRHPKEVSKKPILLNILACAGRMTPCHGHFKPWNRSASVALAANLLFDVKHLNLSIQSLHLSKPRGHGTQHVLVIRLLQNHRSSFKAANSTYSITAWLFFP